MKVLLIHEDNHEVIGVARYEEGLAKWAVDFLVKKDWIDDRTEVYVELDSNNYGWRFLPTIYGKNWQETIGKWSINKFNEVWEGCFYLEEMEVFDTP